MFLSEIEIETDNLTLQKEKVTDARFITPNN
jgi:hypothetical protein